MSMMRQQPFGEPMTLRDAVSRLFEESFISPGRLACAVPTRVPIDVYQQDSNLIVKASLPGARPEDIDVAVTGDVLTIKGEIKREAEAKEENAVRRERCYGAFARTVPLPTKVDTGKVSATFENGVLTLTMPAAAEAKPTGIRVQAR